MISSKTKQLLKYSISIFMFLGALAFLTKVEILSSIFLVAAGCIFFPPFENFIRQHIKLSESLVVRIVTFMIIFAVGMQLNKNFKQKENISDVPWTNYNKRTDENIKRLSKDSLQERDSIYSLLKSDKTYQLLVKDSVINQKYLLPLEVISACLISWNKDEHVYRIPTSQTEYIDKHKTFVRLCSMLGMRGGLPSEIVELYYRYGKEFGNYGIAGTTLIDPNGNIKHTIEENFCLIQAYVVFEYDKIDYLNAYYTAINKGAYYWLFSEDTLNKKSYDYPYLLSKNEFISHLKEIDPKNELLANSTIQQNTSTIKVKSMIVKKVNNKYRYFFDIRNHGNTPFKGAVTIEIITAEDNTIGEETFSAGDNNSIDPNIGKYVYIDAYTAPTHIHGDAGSVKFIYKVTGNENSEGEGKITDKFEDLGY